MSLAYVGPLNLAAHYDPSYSWVSDPSTSGRLSSLSGMTSWDEAKLLSELVANPHRRRTIGSHQGVLEIVWSDDDLLEEFNGWYLLDSVEINAAQRDSLNDMVPVFVRGTRMGEDLRPIVTRSSRPLDNDFTLTQRSLLVEPLHIVGQGFEVDPGGTEFSREHDPRTGWPTTTTTGVDLTMFYGPLDHDAVPLVEDQFGSPPDHIELRGQDVRGYDSRIGRTVWGPSHPFLEPTDLGVTNGILRFKVGDYDEPPRLDVEFFDDGEWKDMGQLYMADPSSSTDELRTARLVRCTPDVATVAIGARDCGPIFVTLKRGEPMVRIELGSLARPTVSRNRQVRWSGSPSGTLGSDGIITETAVGGLLRGLAVLSDDFTQTGGGSFGVQDTAETAYVGAFVARSSGTGNSAANLQEQLAGDSEQEIRLR